MFENVLYHSKEIPSRPLDFPFFINDKAVDISSKVINFSTSCYESEFIPYTYFKYNLINYDFVIILEFFFKNVVGIVNKISTLHIHIRGTDCLQSFSLWIL